MIARITGTVEAYFYAQYAKLMLSSSFNANFKLVMAIPFIFLRYLRLTRHVSLPLLVGYQTRRKVDDVRTRKVFDFRRLGTDLVHEEVVLPDSGDPTLNDPIALARAGDEAETGRVHRWKRTRYPQGGLLLIQALPPDLELHLDEAVELVRRLGKQVRGSLHLPIHFAIHDPSLQTRQSHRRNRHSHILVYLRELGRDGFSGSKVRDLTGRVRRSTTPGFDHCVPEGTSWPDLAWSIQEALFAECGLDLIVDPPAVASDVHWSESALSDKPPNMRARRARQKRANLELINGKPDTFIEKLLRGRGTIRIAEIRRALEKQVLSATERELRLATILFDTEIISLGPTGASLPSHVTTTRLHKLFTQADTIIQSSINLANEPVNRRLLLIRGREFNQITEALHLALDNDTRSAPPRERLILDPHLSVIEKLWIDDPSATRLTPDQALEVVDDWHVGTTIVIPRAHQIYDQLLATLLVSAHVHGARLLLGYNEIEANGVVEHRFAAHAASRIGEPIDVDEKILARGEAARLLRSGLIPQAIERLQAAERLQFADAYRDDEISALMNDESFLVTDDRTLARRTLTKGADSPDQCSGFPVPYEGRYVPLNHGDPVVFTATDYRQRGFVRAGRMVWIESIDGLGRARVCDAVGVHAEIDFKSWRNVRPARILSIREARRTTGLRLAVEANVAPKAWAALVLAADQETASVRIAPQVARNAEELCAVIEMHCVSPVAPILQQITDPKAEHTVLAEEFLNRVCEGEWERKDDPDPFPTPGSAHRQPQPETMSADLSSDEMPQPLARPMPPLPLPIPLDVRLRDRMAKVPAAREGLWNLYRAVAPGTDGARETLQRIRPRIEPGSILGLLVESMTKRVRDRAPIKEARQLDDLLDDAAHSSAAGFTDWDIYTCVDELSSMALASSSWGLARFREGVSLKKYYGDPEPEPDLTQQKPR